MNLSPKIEPDPTLVAEQAAAKNEKIDAIRNRVSSLTDTLVRTFGARSSLLGANLTKPPIAGA